MRPEPVTEGAVLAGNLLLRLECSPPVMRHPPRSRATELIGCAHVLTRQKSTDRQQADIPASDVRRDYLYVDSTSITASPVLGHHARTSIARWPPEAGDSLAITTPSDGLSRPVRVCPGPCRVRADGDAASRRPARGKSGRLQGICTRNSALWPCDVGV